MRHAERVLLILVGSASAVACDRDLSTPAGPGPAGSASRATGGARKRSAPAGGDTRIAESYRLRLLNVQPCKTKPFYRVQPGFRNLGVEVEVEATGAQRVPANVFYARIVDSEHREYRAQLGGCAPALRHRPLARGESASGWITFEIPEAETRLVFSYSPFLLDGGTQEVRFEIGAGSRRDAG